MSLFRTLFLLCCIPAAMLSTLKAQQVAQMTADPNSGRLVFSLNAPIALSVSTDYTNGGTIGFVLRNVYSEAKGSAVGVFTNVFNGSGVENTLRAYIPRLNVTTTTSYGTWGTRPNSSGDITARDFFGSITLNGFDLVAGDQVILLPGQVTLQANAANLLPETLNDATDFQFIHPGTSASLSTAAGIGAITVTLPPTTVNVSVTPTTVVVNWTGPGILQQSGDLGLTMPWETIISNANELQPPRTFFRSIISRQSNFYRMATPWNLISAAPSS